MTRKTRRLFAISREPAPYKTDLYNAIADLPGWQLSVFYAASKDWAADGGHDFKDFPPSRFKYEEVKGKGLCGQVFAALKVGATILGRRPDTLLISGYQGLPYITAMLLCRIVAIPFFMQVDQFNTGRPRFQAALPMRNCLRRFVFRHASGLLVCGRMGRESALLSGCPVEKIYDFPYVIDARRLTRLSAERPSPDLLPIAESGKAVILFSGRLIERKGLHVLLRALKRLEPSENNYVLVVEGNGPLRANLEDLAAQTGLGENCLFVGFRQMTDHAFLLNNSHIVVVPSLADPWGIVVHEGMLMGKPVCSSSNVGCGVDRIKTGETGFLFTSGSDEELAAHLKLLLSDKGLRERIGESACREAFAHSPERNARTFAEAYENAVSK
jgi:glycosyltransferase involved in cell wall biosynthesis